MTLKTSLSPRIFPCGRSSPNRIFSRYSQSHIESDVAPVLLRSISMAPPRRCQIPTHPTRLVCRATPPVAPACRREAPPSVVVAVLPPAHSFARQGAELASVAPSIARARWRFQRWLYISHMRRSSIDGPCAREPPNR